jgi:N-carbamoylputrescine amidase
MARRAILSGLAAAAGAAATPPARRTQRIAVVQMPSANGAIEDNLGRATRWAAAAARAGAGLVLFPELMPTGYSLYTDIWDAAEPGDGPTARWLGATARRWGVYIGTSFLEADGEDFYNTFVLTGPDGAEAGRVRKAVPADVEAYFFKGAMGPHVIETAIGRIGVGVCAESYYCALAEAMRTGRADLILMPHSAADCSASGALPAAPGTHLGLWYAAHLGVPVAFANKVGPWRSRAIEPPPLEATGFFPGRSAIVDGDGRVLADMDGREGFAVADVTLDPARRIDRGPVCEGVGIAELTIGGPAGAASVMRAQDRGAAFYEASAVRRRKALAVSARRPRG